jgi:hypothetical protein
MGTIMEDLSMFKTRILIIFSWTMKIFKLLSFVKKVKETTDIDTVVKVSIFKLLSFKIWPKARLTYWLADEEVVVYVDKFYQKDKFKLAFREIISGKTVLVNSANPINYRLEELSPYDTIIETIVQQNQRYN